MLLKTVKRTTSARIPTEYGEFQLCCYSNSEDAREHQAFFLGEIDQGEDILVRVHSECFTGEVLDSTRCDCGEQLDRALQMISKVERMSHVLNLKNIKKVTASDVLHEPQPTN